MREAQQIAFGKIGDDDHLPYATANLVKACVVGDSVALSFYQMDFLAVANRAGGLSDVDYSRMLIPVAKIVMGPAGFAEFRAEMARLEALVAPQGTE